ncbi:hypothetical protein Esi_0022_0146 [Ectocarpus siliculosus]|uniref:Uncharacterized protein n=1 Tax=Ectocarpus siliculosus TaxID=2880 RepID=D8LIJ6_ECTSI|nr:hypothetical protein Esi_0022_0146 [Ectocarpus siliculosus]|eukprot:CBN80035.1 hypothetical protein Esi_0022_0146 [Ectocarpus siliculosus]
MALSSSHAESLFSPRTPFDMLRNPSLPELLRERLESIRTAFLDSATDLPASYPRIAERVLDMASGNATCTTKLVTPAAVCCPIDRFALHVFRTAGAAGEAGSTVYTDVQELAGIGGLDTQTSENSLWSAAARAGIVDVERWVVAAVLWQAADAVASTDKSCVPAVQSPWSTEGATNVMAGDDTSDAEAVSTKAMSLWEELRDEAFRSVLTRSSKNQTHGTVPNAEPSTSSPAKAGTLSTPRKHDHQREGPLVLVGEDVVSHRVDRRALQRYEALRSVPSSFDHALTRTLVLASGTGAEAAAAAAGASPTAGDRASGDSGVGGSLDCVEDILLHNFVVAGFVDGSCLSVSDIVDAVSARRQRVALTATAGGPISGGDKEGMDNGVVSDENGHRPAKPQALTELPEDHRHRLSRGEPVPRGETLAASVIKGEEEPMSDDNAATISSMLETDVESRLLLGIPAELRGLFRAATLAGVVRKKQQQQQHGHQGSLEKDELENAERGILQVLDSNRTLETAPFSGGRTALHHAAARGDEFLVRLLLDRGCKPHLQDFEGKRASDLTRDLKCLRLLGALKKGCEPSAVSLRGRRQDEEAATASGEKEERAGEKPLSRARAMANVEFAVSFRLRGDEETVGGTLGDTVRSDGSSETPRDWKQHERAEDEQIRIIHRRGAWVNGVARSYDLRNKVLLIDEIYPEIGPRGTTATAHPTIDSSGSAENETGGAISTQGQLPDEEQLRDWRSTGGERRSYRCSRHVLDLNAQSFELGGFRRKRCCRMEGKTTARVENGVSTVVVRGRSYLDAVGAEKRGGSGNKPINLEGRDAGIQRVLDHHGVTLSACLQTFDVMQLSVRYLEEGVEFASLPQSEQDTMKADVLSQLYQATSHSPRTVPEWDELKIMIQAYGGVTSVSLSRTDESSKTPVSDGKQDLVVSAPTTAGWFSTDEVTAALTSPPTLQDSLPTATAASSSFAEPLPPSAVNLVVTLMRCNPCEVLGSLCRGIDTDGRIALIGRVENGGANSQASAIDTSGGRAGGKGGGVNDGCAFRCSLEVAWDKDEGGVFVRRFSMERDEKRPSFTLRAVGIRGFSIAQLPVTLADIDEVEDQGGIDDTSGSDTTTSHGRSRGSTNSSVTTLRSSQGGKGQPSPPASSVAGSAKSVSTEESSERATHSATLVQSAAPAERGNLIQSAAAATATTSRTATSAASVSAEAPLAKFSSAQDESEESSQKPETTAAAATATAAVAAGGIAPRGTGEGDDDFSWTSDQRLRYDGEETSEDHGRSMREDRIVESVAKENLDQPSEVAINDATKGVVSKQEGRRGAAGASSPEAQVDTNDAEGSRQAGSEVVTTNEKPASGGGLNEMAEANIDDRSRGQGETEEVNEGRREDKKHDDNEGREESTEEGAGSQEGEEEALEQQKREAEDEDGSESTRERKQLACSGNTDAGEDTRPVDTGPPLRGSDGILLRRGSTEEVVKANTTTSMDVGAVANRVPKDMITPLVKRGSEGLHSARSIGIDDGHGGSDARCATTGQVQTQALPHANREALAPDIVRADESISLQRDTGRAADPAAVLGEGASSVGMLNAAGEDLGTTPVGDAKDDGTFLKATSHRDTADEVVVEGPINNEPLGVLAVPSSHPLIGSAPGTIEDIKEVNNGDGNGDVEELLRQQDKRNSSPLTDGEGANDDGQATSATKVTPLETGEYEYAPADVLDVADEGGTKDNEGVPPRLNEEVALENEEGRAGKQHELNQTASVVDAQRLQDQTADDVNGKSEEDAVNFSQDKVAADKADQGDLNREDADRMATTSNSTDSGDLLPTNVWTFPPSFEALMTLSTANNTVECKAEGEITLEVEAATLGEEQASTHGNEGQTKKKQRATSVGSPENNVEPFWRSRYCIYRIAVEEGSQTPPVADIDLEDDDAQTRLEQLLGGSYGLTMEEVLDRFSPETDLGSGGAVVRSFTNSICELRPSLLRGQPKSTSSDDGRPGGGDSRGRSDDDSVYKAVEAALRGRGGGAEWQEVQVRVGTSRVLEVRVVTTSSDETTRGEDIVESGSNPGGPSATTSVDPPSKGAVCTSVVDCSGIDSPPALRPHILAGGVPASVADALDRAGFFTPGPAVDLAGVFAALADEAKTGGPSETHAATGISQSSPGVKQKEGTGGWPGLDRARSRRKELHVPHGARRSGSFATIHKCTVAVTGTPEDIQLDILPAVVDDQGFIGQAGVTTARLSRLRPLGTSSLRCSPAPALASEGEEAVAAERHRNNRNHSDSDSKGRESSSEEHKPENVSSQSAPSSREHGAGLTVGDRVEARYGGKSEWFPGTVREIHDVDDAHTPASTRDVVAGGGGNGGGNSGLKSKLCSVAIDYDDGDTEERVPRVRVRLVGQKQPRFLNEGDEVDVKRGKKIRSTRRLNSAATPDGQFRTTSATTVRRYTV